MMAVHTHTDARPTFGCDACIDALHAPKVPLFGVSATIRLTLRNRAQLDRGIHPATLRPLADNGQTCGTCDHHHRYHYHNGHFHKCDVHRLGESHSAASDIRVGWPACSAWQAINCEGDAS